MKGRVMAFRAIVTGIPDMIHEAACYNCDWSEDIDGATGRGRSVLTAAKAHVAETGHRAWKHSIRLFFIDPDQQVG